MTLATEGYAEVLGARMPSRQTLARIGYMTQSDGIYPALTVGENARFFAAAYGADTGASVTAALELVELADRAKTITGTLSGGQRRRLSLACALVHRPEVLFLDEPTVGVDPLLRVQFWGHFRSLADAGATIVVSSHVMDEADRCDELLFMRAGRVIARGTGRTCARRRARPTSRPRSSRSPATARWRHEPAAAARPHRAGRGGDPARPSEPGTPVHRPARRHGPPHVHPPRGRHPRGQRRPGQRGERPGGTVGTALTTALEDEGITVSERPRRGDGSGEGRGQTVSLAIVVPADLATGGQITIVTLGLDPGGEAAQLGVVREAVSTAVAGVTGGHVPVVVHETIYGTPSDDPMVAFAPAIVAFFLYFFVYLLTGVSFLRERTGGTLERLMATPVTRGEVVTGYTLGFGLFAMLQVAVLLAWALGTIHVPAIGPLPSFAIGLGIPVAGSPLLAYLVVVMLALGAVSLGIFLSTFARTELQVIQFIPIVLVPQFLLSGVLFPVNSLPAILQPLVAIMPLGYAVDALRQVFIRGADLSVAELRFDIIVLALVAVLFAFVASRTIRRDVV